MARGIILTEFISHGMRFVKNCVHEQVWLQAIVVGFSFGTLMRTLRLGKAWPTPSPRHWTAAFCVLRRYAAYRALLHLLLYSTHWRNKECPLDLLLPSSTATELFQRSQKEGHALKNANSPPSRLEVLKRLTTAKSRERNTHSSAGYIQHRSGLLHD